MTFLSKSWYVINSIPYVVFSILFFAIVVFIFVSPFIPKVKIFLKKHWITVPLTFVFTILFSFNFFKFVNYIQKSGVSSEAERRELKAQLQIEQAENSTLKDEIENLKHAALNIQNFMDICELNLLETDMKSTIAHTKNIDDITVNASGTKSHGKQFWMVTNYNFEGVKYGIDLKNVKIYENDNTLHVSGIKAKYNGTKDIKEPNDVLLEIRSYDAKDGFQYNEKVLYDKYSKVKLDELAKAYHKLDRDRFQNTTDEFDWVNKIVEKSAQSFFRTYLNSVNKNIVFDENESENSVPINEFLNTKIKEKEALLNASFF